MSQAYYDIYIDQVKTLAKTMVIKSVASALAVNSAVQMEDGYPVNEVDPTTWKYYLNLAGEYHPVDTVMTVISLDTQQTIEFTKENLQIHLATAREYKFGTQYYVDLLARYPDQEELILGIINPIDLSTAISADDNAILWYDPRLVETNETNLIPELQKWINGYMFRWNVQDYSLADDLYVAAQLGLMYVFLPTAILNIRLANCHTRFVHSYHIKEYLASNSALDVYVPYLTSDQQLWLYRNIRYLQRNAGKQDTFEWLVQNILTVRGVPLAQWSMRHDLEHMPDQLYPDVTYTRAPLNLGYNKAGVDVKTTDDLLNDEDGLAKSNALVHADALPTIEAQMKYGLFDQLKTKVLESNTIDTSDALPFTLTDALMNHWLYLTSLGIYSTFITINNPATSDKYTITVADAFVLFYYCFWAQYGFVFDTIPPFTANLVRRIPRPELSELLEMTDPNTLSGEVVKQLWQLPSNIPTSIISVAGFNQIITDVHQDLMDQRTLYTQTPTFAGRACAEAVALRMYQDVECSIAEGQSYATWLDARNIKLDGMVPSQYGELATQLAQMCTGQDLNSSNTLSNTQAALLAIMARLSSYTIQFVQKINSSVVHVADWAAPRLGDIHELDMLSARIDTAPVRIIEHHQKVRGQILLDPTRGGLTYKMDVLQKQSVKLDVNLNHDFILKFNRAMHVSQPHVQLRQVVPDPVNITGTVNGSSIPAYGIIDVQPLSNALQ